MSGLPGPSDAELMKRLEKRVNEARQDKRFYRNGVDPVPASSEDLSVKSSKMMPGCDNGNGNNNSTNK